MSIDDCWERKAGRAPNGSLIPNSTRFPAGLCAPPAPLRAPDLR